VQLAEIALGPDAQCGARSVATRGTTACAALARPTASVGRSACGPRTRPACATLAQLDLGRAALLGEPAAARHRRTETTGKRRLIGAETAARRGGGSGDGSARTAGARTRPVGAAVAFARQLSVARVSARRGRAGGRGVRGSCQARCYRGAALSRQRFKPCCRRGARRLTSGACSSVISELKFTPKEISSN
jgi:hypothetical protein